MSLATAPCETRTCQSALVIGTDPQAERVLRIELSRQGLEVSAATSVAEALSELQTRHFDLIFVAARLHDVDGTAFIRQTAKLFTKSRFVLAGDGAEPRAEIEALRAGADDFLPLPVTAGEVSALLERSGGEGKSGEQALAPRAAGDFEDIVTISPVLKRAIAEAGKVAAFKTPVLLLGESGTGKELFTHAIHAASPRAGGPMVAVNCANLPEALLESQLFGHVRGAFTGAQQSHDGFVGEAAGGTLFLDEIGELGPGLQAKLLRFLQEGEYRPVGASKPQRADVRIIAATNVVMEQAIERGAFRADLYYRLAVFPIVIPPLRERREDVMLLARHFLDLCAVELGCRIPRIEPTGAELLMNFEWPGNVRQLANVLERAMILYSGQNLDAVHLAPLLKAANPGHYGAPDCLPAPARMLGWELPLEGVNLEELQDSLMLQALGRADGNITRAARLVGLSRPAFRYRISRLVGAAGSAENAGHGSKSNLYEMVQRRIN
jgi:DNA-binding NtrC family response regulator